MDPKISDCVIRKLRESDYDSYLVIINEFRETFFTKKQFEDTLTYMMPYSEIWIIEYKHEIVATGSVVYEKKFIHNNS
jgi:hypothetical protein